ncbi:unnamed protein product [Sphagnum jensenii]|uniref:Dirigent protein n=1 Tax=Sphagnum jensenii TaxID=128206 RepID=A0ABP1C163_9BRYO
MLLMAVGVLLICCNISGASAFKTHNVTFFVHDSILVPNATATIVAGPGVTSRSYRRVRSFSQTPSSPKLLTPTRLRRGSSRVSTSWTEASSIALRRPSSSTFLEIFKTEKCNSIQAHENPLVWI